MTSGQSPRRWGSIRADEPITEATPDGSPVSEAPTESAGDANGGKAAAVAHGGLGDVATGHVSATAAAAASHEPVVRGITRARDVRSAAAAADVAGAAERTAAAARTAAAERTAAADVPYQQPRKKKRRVGFGTLAFGIWGLIIGAIVLNGVIFPMLGNNAAPSQIAYAYSSHTPQATATASADPSGADGSGAIASPSDDPIASPSDDPTASPTSSPTAKPTPKPTAKPIVKPPVPPVPPAPTPAPTAPPTPTPAPAMFASIDPIPDSRVGTSVNITVHSLPGSTCTLQTSNGLTRGPSTDAPNLGYVIFSWTRNRTDFPAADPYTVYTVYATCVAPDGRDANSPVTPFTKTH